MFNSCILNNCKPIGPDPYIATASLAVSPQSGIAPLTVTYSVTGNPADKIERYVLTINGPGSSGSSASVSSIIPRKIDSFIPQGAVSRTQTGRNSLPEIRNSRTSESVRNKRDIGRTDNIGRISQETLKTNSQTQAKAEVSSVYKNTPDITAEDFPGYYGGFEETIPNYQASRRINGRPWRFSTGWSLMMSFLAIQS